jgi:hypothetical protein
MVFEPMQSRVDLVFAAKKQFLVRLLKGTQTKIGKLELGAHRGTRLTSAKNSPRSAGDPTDCEAAAA